MRVFGNRARRTAQVQQLHEVHRHSRAGAGSLAPRVPLLAPAGSAGLRVLFCAAAGPRQGYGHLLRCRALARALGVRPLICVRGPRMSVDVALRCGCDVVHGSPRRLLRALRPDVAIVDDPTPSAAARWIGAARHAGIAVASIHDLGIGCHEADLLIDGSVVCVRDAHRRGAVVGPAFAIVDPALERRAAAARHRQGVVISLGGGPRAAAARAIAAEIAHRAPDVNVRLIGGFGSKRLPTAGRRRLPRNVVWVGPSTDLAGELARASVAVVGGGVSLYEACALGTPAVGVAVVRNQRRTVAGFVARGAALGQPLAGINPRQVADDVVNLLGDRRLRHQLARTARRLIDGRGAWRAADAVVRLTERA